VNSEWERIAQEAWNQGEAKEWLRDVVTHIADLVNELHRVTTLASEDQAVTVGRFLDAFLRGNTKSWQSAGSGLYALRSAVVSRITSADERSLENIVLAALIVSYIAGRHSEQDIID